MSTTQAPRAFRWIMSAVNVSLILFGAYVAGSIITANYSVEFQNPTQGTSTSTTAPDPVEVLIREHECWTEGNEAPEGAIPSKSIVSPEGKGPKVAAADRGFRIWLEDAPGTVHAFCP